MTRALHTWSTVVPEEWIDYNGHLNEGYYAVGFGEASDDLLTHIGFDHAYRVDRGTFYTAETHIRYLREVAHGASISCRTILLSADSKRLHIHHDLIVGDDCEPVATQESMMLHVAHPGPKVTPMQEPVLSAALALAAAHTTLPRPSYLGTGVRQLARSDPSKGTG